MAFYRERGLRELGTEISTEGIGIGGGFIVGGAVGRQVENILFKTPVTPDSTITNKVGAWAANNGAKALLYLLAKQYDAKTAITNEATKALAGSIVYDTVLRVVNKGYNPADVNLGGYRILGENGTPAQMQKVVQENSLLRTELNKALQKLAQAPNAPGSSADFKYGGAPSPAVAERQRAYGSMPLTPDVAERQRKYGAMPFEQSPEKSSRERKYGFMSYGAETQSAATFGMQ